MHYELHRPSLNGMSDKSFSVTMIVNKKWMGHTVLEDCQHPYIMYHNNTHTLKQNVIAFIGKSREIQKNKNPNQNMPGSTLSW